MLGDDGRFHFLGIEFSTPIELFEVIQRRDQLTGSGYLDFWKRIHMPLYHLLKISEHDLWRIINIRQKGGWVREASLGGRLY